MAEAQTRWVPVVSRWDLQDQLLAAALSMHLLWRPGMQPVQVRQTRLPQGKLLVPWRGPMAPVPQKKGWPLALALSTKPGQPLALVPHTRQGQPVALVPHKSQGHPLARVPSTRRGQLQALALRTTQGQPSASTLSARFPLYRVSHMLAAAKLSMERRWINDWVLWQRLLPGLPGRQQKMMWRQQRLHRAMQV